MRKYVLFFLVLVLTVVICPIKAQSKFQLRSDLKSQKINFKLINNIIIIPIEINGKELSFILDSGVSSTILFNLTASDSLQLMNVEKMLLQGLGEGDDVEALVSRNNHFRIKNIQNTDQHLYIIINNKIDLSAKFGETIHGIIGYDLLKDFIVKIDYTKKRLIFYNPEKYNYKKCRKCEVFDLEFNKNKPYINATAAIFENQMPFPVKLLIDSGGSDALWLFEDSKIDIKTPPLNFYDYLGEGLSGSIYGKRSRIHLFKIGGFEFKEPTASFPDSTSIAFVKTFKERNGSVGGKILRRFDVIFDYPNQKIALKKNNYFKKPFNYNMSGIDLVYHGQMLVKEKEETSFRIDPYNTSANTADQKTVILSYNYTYKFKPTYKISYVSENSPAFEAGLKKDDIFLSINGIPAHKYKLEELTYFFYHNENDKLKIEVERNGVLKKFEFRLRRMF